MSVDVPSVIGGDGAIRSVPANPRDNVNGTRLAYNAAHAAMGGRSEMFVGRRHGRFVRIPMGTEIRERNKVDPDGDLSMSVRESTGQPRQFKQVRRFGTSRRAGRTSGRSGRSTPCPILNEIPGGIMAEQLPRAVIIGGGFGGLNAARALERAPVRVTLIDRRNHHLFQPLLYQVATAGLNPSDIASPIRRILRKQQNAEVLLAEARAVDLDAKTLVLDRGSIPYDYLIVATGARHSYFGRDEWTAYAPGLKSIGDALEIRRRVLSAFEEAEREPDPAKRPPWLTFVVVGAGPTGVELSGALCEIAQHALARDFRHIDPTQARVILLEGSPRVLPPYPPDLSEKAREQLVRLGVDVRTGKMVTSIDAEGVDIGDERIATRTVLWAAGVAGSRFGKALGVPLDRAGRVAVRPDLSIPGHPEVFVVGDLASLAIDGVAVPGVAPAAIQEGEHAAKNVLRAIRGEPALPFRYVDKGSLATIGRSAAVAELGKVHLSGPIAWLAWLFIHLLFLIGFRNRALVLFQWAWSFITYDRGARLITGPLNATQELARAGDLPRTTEALVKSSASKT